MVTYELHPGEKISPEEKRILEEAKKKPVIYDEDSPELTEKMEQAFRLARRMKPYRAPVTLYIAPETLERAKTLGEDYLSIMGRLLEQAVNTYQTPGISG